MTMDYSKLDNKELDIISGKFVRQFCTQTLHELVCYDANKETASISENHIHNWHPTDPDSNQVERYILPKLIEMNLYKSDNKIIVQSFDDDAWCVDVSLYKETYCGDDDPFRLPDAIRGSCFVQKSEDINRAKVIACLNVLQQLKEESKNA